MATCPKIPAHLHEARKRPAYSAAFNKAMRSGLPGLAPEEVRALGVDSDILGGYLVPSARFTDRLLSAIMREAPILGLCSKFTMPDAMGIAIPRLDTDASGSAAFLADDEAISADTSLRFGSTSLIPKRAAVLVKATRAATRAPDFEKTLAEKILGPAFAELMDEKTCNGTGIGEPLGVFVAEATGISTGRDVVSGGSNALTVGGFAEALDLVPAAHRSGPGVAWAMSPEVWSELLKLSTAGDHVDYSPRGEPRLFGVPVKLSDAAPSTIADGNYVAVCGDFRAGYGFAEEGPLLIQPLTEKYAADSQIGYMAAWFCDAAPLDERHFARVVVGSA